MIIPKKWLVGASVFVLLLVALFLFQSEEDEGAEMVVVNEPTETVSPEETIEEENGLIWVDVKGFVANPAVYQIEEGSRVKDVIEMAGGFKEQANELSVNQAELLQDEMVIYVPEEGEEAAPNYSSASSDGKIKINVAGLEDIMTLPGIGEQKANRIIEYRESNGKFQSPEDLLNISGIGEKTLEQFKEMIIVP